MFIALAMTTASLSMPTIAQAAASTYAATVGADSPSAYWRFREAAGAPVAQDTTINGVSLTLDNVTLGVPGAVNLDSDTAASFGAASTAIATTAPFASTVEFWFKTAQPPSDSRPFVSADNAGTGSSYSGWEVALAASGLIELTMKDGAGATPSSPNGGTTREVWGPNHPAADGKWHQVVATLNGSSATVYVDGDPGAAGGSVSPFTPPCMVECSEPPAGSLVVSGDLTSLDELALYPGVLTPEQVGHHFVDRTPAGDYSYADAVQYGLNVPATPVEQGLPACATSDADWVGDDSPDATLDDDSAPSCAVDPSTATVSWGAAPPAAAATDPDYRWVGAQTIGTYSGGRIGVEVGDPSVDHYANPPDCRISDPRLEFVAARTLAHLFENEFPIGKAWLEAGWIETSCRPDNRYVYGFESRYYGNFSAGQYYWPAGYHLVTGKYYKFRVRDCDFGMCGDIYWNGAWRRYETYRASPDLSCETPQLTEKCIVEEFLEVHSQDGTWPEMNAPIDGAGVNFRNTMLRTSPGNWTAWTVASSPNLIQDTSPYIACWAANYTTFRVTKAATC